MPDTTEVRVFHGALTQAFCTHRDECLAECIYLTVTLSPDPLAGRAAVCVSDFFQHPLQIKSFVVRRNVKLVSLDMPYHIFYCGRSYNARQNPNQALVRLTRFVDTSPRHHWYGTVLVLKFSSRACQEYVDMTVEDVIQVRDYFAYFA